MGLQVLQALHQLLGGVKAPPKGQLQASGELGAPEGNPAPVDQARPNDPQQQLTSQNLYRVQPTGNFNQQQLQPGVVMHNLAYLASLGNNSNPTGALPPDMVNVPWSSHQVPYGTPAPQWYNQQLRNGPGRPVNLN